MIYCKTCIECGKDFATESKQLVTCSEACRKKRAGKIATEHSRMKRLEAQEAEKAKDKICEFCGCVFHSSRANQIYCSDGCYKKAKYKTDAEKRKSIKPVTKKKPKTKSLSELAREARENGMDYGSYIVWLEGRTI